jgi:hypothetical protein
MSQDEKRWLLRCPLQFREKMRCLGDAEGTLIKCQVEIRRLLSVNVSEEFGCRGIEREMRSGGRLVSQRLAQGFMGKFTDPASTAFLEAHIRIEAKGDSRVEIVRL